MSVAQIRAADRLAIDTLGVPSIVLMENAGKNVAESIRNCMSREANQGVVILCGPGNNGGDGFVVARHLAMASIGVTIVCSTARDRYAGDAALNLRIIERLGLTTVIAGAAADAAAGKIAAADLIVDALLGTGSAGSPREPVAGLIRAANANQRATRIAIDIPSGLNADTGAVGDPCFRAHQTITLFAMKAGFDAPPAREVLGIVTVADIGVPAEWCFHALQPRSAPDAQPATDAGAIADRPLHFRSNGH